MTEGPLVHLFICAWTAGSRFTSKVKSIAFRSTLQFPQPITFFDVSPDDSQLALVFRNDQQRLHFYDLHGLEFHEEETTIALKQPAHSADIFARVIDFYWSKEEVVSRFTRTTFLLVQTPESFLIFGKPPDQPPRKVFSVRGDYSDTFRCKFTFFSETTHTGERLTGLLGSLHGDTLTLQLVVNLETGKQPLLLRTTRSALDFSGFKRTLSFDVSSMDHVTVILADPTSVVAKYVTTLKEAADQLLQAKETMLIGRHVNVSFYLYNANASFVYGKVDQALSRFQAFKKVAESDFGFKVLGVDFPQLQQDAFWSLVNESQFVVVSPATKTLSNLFIDKDNTVSLQEERALDLPEPCYRRRPNAVRFLKVSQRKVAFGIESDNFISIFEVVFAMKQIESVELVCSLDKSKEIGSTAPVFYQLNLLKTPQRIYKVYFLVNPKRLVALEFELRSRVISAKQEVALPEPALEIFKSKQFPYNLVVFTGTERLIVLDNSLKIQTTFDLSRLRPLLGPAWAETPITGNFVLKHLYDRFFIVASKVFDFRAAVRWGSGLRGTFQLLPLQSY